MRKSSDSMAIALSGALNCEEKYKHHIDISAYSHTMDSLAIL